MRAYPRPAENIRTATGWAAAAQSAGPPAALEATTAGADVVPQGKLVVLGDNVRSTDSRTSGFYSVNQVLGTVVRRLAPVAPAGRQPESGLPSSVRS